MAVHPFRAAVEARDHEALVACLADDVVMHSPVTFKPFEGKPAVAHVLGAVMRVFEDFHYTDEIAGEALHALVFRARVGGRQVEGIDLLRPAADGRVADLTVMLRPLTATQAMAAAMAEELGTPPP